MSHCKQEQSWILWWWYLQLWTNKRINSGYSCTNTSTTNATITLVNSTISRMKQNGGGV